jgi:hypothetical protein
VSLDFFLTVHISLPFNVRFNVCISLLWPLLEFWEVSYNIWRLLCLLYCPVSLWCGSWPVVAQSYNCMHNSMTYGDENILTPSDSICIH